MGRRRHSQPPPRKSDLGHSAPIAAQADDEETVRHRQTCLPDVFPAPRFGTRNRYQILAVCGFLLLAVAMVFGQTIRYQFVNYDDTVYVCENPHVAGGLTAQGIAWVFTHQHGGNWHPLTSLSHMLDCQLYGLNAGGHHLTNVLLHAATAVLLFLVLWRMTGGFWPGAVVAALFAVHPLRVESVAWVFGAEGRPQRAVLRV